MKEILIVLSCLWVATASTAHQPLYSPRPARNYPGDAGYPNPGQWAAFNKTLDGKLLLGRPAAAVCYPPILDNTTCTAIAAEQIDMTFALERTVDIDVHFWAGNQCPVVFSPKGTCGQGNFSDYVVNATTATDVKDAIDFSNQFNLRTIVKNTGHDFLGRNIGFGSLEIWVHNLRTFNFSTKFVPVGSSQSTAGISAVTFGTGWSTGELLPKLSPFSQFITFPNENSVAIGGGYFMGGGHSPASQITGLAVDNVLQITVVTATCQILICNEHSYPDLFWALLGGGAGFAVVIEVTMKTYNIPTQINGFNFTFAAKDASNISVQAYEQAVAVLISNAQEIIDAGITSYPQCMQTSCTGYLMGWNKTLDEVSSFLNPFFNTIGALNVTLLTNPINGNTAFNTSVPPVPALGFQITSRLLSGVALRDLSQVTKLVSDLYAAGALLLQPFLVTGGAVYTNRNKHVSVNPGFRDAAMHLCVLNVPMSDDWNVAVKSFEVVTDVWTPLIEPFSIMNASYVNEADPNESHFEISFWGKNAFALREIKKKYDPENRLWAPASIGSQELVLGPDGKLYFPSKSVAKW